MSRINSSRKVIAANQISSTSRETWPVLTIQVSTSEHHQQAVVRASKRIKNGFISIGNFKTNEDLQALKDQDPFMYYSIPVVRDATLLFQDVDVSLLDKKSPIQRSGISRPVRIQSECGDCSAKQFMWKSRLSMECHADLILSNFLGRSNSNDDDCEAADFLDNFLKLYDWFQWKKDQWTTAKTTNKTKILQNFEIDAVGHPSFVIRRNQFLYFNLSISIKITSRCVIITEIWNKSSDLPRQFDWWLTMSFTYHDVTIICST